MQTYTDQLDLGLTKLENTRFEIEDMLDSIRNNQTNRKP